MKYLIDEFASPVVGETCTPGLFTNQGNPIATGRTGVKGHHRYREFSFTKNRFFRKPIQILAWVEDGEWKEDVPFIVTEGLPNDC